MKKLNLIHLGIGNVGKEVKAQILAQKDKVEKDFGVSLEYTAEFTSKNSQEEINKAIQSVSLPFVLIDTTASDETVPYIAAALKRRGFVVLANKKPLAGLQADFDMLHQTGGKRLFYECVVGAGLPVIRTLKDLLATGDQIQEIKGCFSGTLGFLFSAIEDGSKFSDAVLAAKEKRYTEPDPRDDLSGLDVARKALILSRILGRRIELSDIDLTSLYPESMSNLTVNEFFKKVHQLDGLYQKQIDNAKKKNQTLRFVATVGARKCTVGLETVSKDSDLGGLKGPDNIIVFKTKRYFDRPMVIKGPGAGIQVTAAGIFGDILTIANMICFTT